MLDDVSVLKTLPRQMIAEGYAEAIKHAFIRSPELLENEQNEHQGRKGAREDAEVNSEPGIDGTGARRERHELRP